MFQCNMPENVTLPEGGAVSHVIKNLEHFSFIETSLLFACI